MSLRLRRDLQELLAWEFVPPSLCDHTTAICYSNKLEGAFQAGHCFNATQSGVTVTNTSGQATLTALASTANLAIGMGISGTNVQAGSIIISFQSATALTMSLASSGGAVTSATFTADAFKLALIKASPTRTFDGTQTNIGTPGAGSPTATNLGTDEIAASGTYSSGGMALTNTQPQLISTTTAVASFSNVSITGATISTTGAIIYNTTTRLGAAATPLNGRTVSVHDFGGTQTVTAGTLTLTMPNFPDAANSLLRVT